MFWGGYDRPSGRPRQYQPPGMLCPTRVCSMLAIIRIVLTGLMPLAMAAGIRITGGKGPRRDDVRIALRGWSSTQDTDGDAAMCDMRVVVAHVSGCTAAASDKATVPGAVATPHPTIINLAIEWMVEGDDNLDGVVSVRYRAAGE